MGTVKFFKTIDYSYLKLCKSGNLSINRILIDFCHLIVCSAYRNTEMVVSFSENKEVLIMYCFLVLSLRKIGNFNH